MKCVGCGAPLPKFPPEHKLCEPCVKAIQKMELPVKVYFDPGRVEASVNVASLVEKARTMGYIWLGGQTPSD